MAFELPVNPVEPTTFDSQTLALEQSSQPFKRQFDRHGDTDATSTSDGELPVVTSNSSLICMKKRGINTLSAIRGDTHSFDWPCARFSVCNSSSCVHKFVGRAADQFRQLNQTPHHIRRHFVCLHSGCDRAFFSKPGLQRHVKTHIHNDLYQFSQMGFSMNASSSTILNQHTISPTTEANSPGLFEPVLCTQNVIQTTRAMDEITMPSLKVSQQLSTTEVVVSSQDQSNENQNFEVENHVLSKALHTDQPETIKSASSTPGVAIRQNAPDTASTRHSHGHATFVLSERRKKKLVFGSHSYFKDRTTTNKVFWRCVKYYTTKCCARVHTIGEEVVAAIGAHNHPGTVSELPHLLLDKTSTVEQTIKANPKLSISLLQTDISPSGSNSGTTDPTHPSVCNPPVLENQNSGVCPCSDSKSISETNVPATASGNQPEHTTATPPAIVSSIQEPIQSQSFAFIPSEKGRRKLVVGGHSYVREKATGEKVWWKCSKYYVSNCRARVHTKSDQLIAQTGVHNHAANLAEVQALEVTRAIRNLAAYSWYKPETVIETCLSGLPESVLAALPKSNSLKQLIRRERSRRSWISLSIKQ